MIVCGGNSTKLVTLFKEHGAAYHTVKKKSNLAPLLEQENAALLIVKGALLTSVVSGDGKTHILYCMGPNTIFDREAFSTKRDKQSIHLTAATDQTECLLISKDTLLQLKTENPKLCKAADLDRESCLTYMMEVSNMFNAGTALQRVSSFIKALSGAKGNLPYTQSYLTNLLDLSISQVWRSATQLRKDEVILTTGKGLILTDPQKLENYLPDSMKFCSLPQLK